MTKIKNIIKGKVLFIGVGNEIRGDDAAGLKFIKMGKDVLKEYFFINAKETPENYLESILSINPDTLIFVDAVDYGVEPGRYKLFVKDEIKNCSVSTHNASLKLPMDYLLAHDGNINIYLLGIQPKSCKLNENISLEVNKCIKNLIKKL